MKAKSVISRKQVQVFPCIKRRLCIDYFAVINISVYAIPFVTTSSTAIKKVKFARFLDMFAQIRTQLLDGLYKLFVI